MLFLYINRLQNVFFSKPLSFFFSGILEMESAPRNVQVRPLSPSMMMITWEPPETPNGQVTVSFSFSSSSFYVLFFFVVCFQSKTLNFPNESRHTLQMCIDFLSSSMCMMFNCWTIYSIFESLWFAKIWK